MKNTKEFTVIIEKIVKVTLDMDKYTPETIQQINDFHGYFHGDLYDDYLEEDVIEECVEDIAQQYIKGYDVSDLEGFAAYAQKCVENGYPYIRVEENS